MRKLCGRRSRVGGPRYRDTITRTFYSDDDRRMLLGSLTVTRTSDGRTHSKARMYNGYTHADLRDYLDYYSPYLNSISPKLLK